MISMVFMLVSDMNGEFDRAVFEWLFGDAVASATAFDFRALHRIRLKKPMEFCQLAPSLAKIVVADVSRREIADRGVTPAGQVDREARRFAAKEAERALGRFGQMQTLARSAGGFGVFDLGFDVDDVRHGFLSTRRGRE